MSGKLSLLQVEYDSELYLSSKNCISLSPSPCRAQVFDMGVHSFATSTCTEVACATWDNSLPFLARLLQLAGDICYVIDSFRD